MSQNHFNKIAKNWDQKVNHNHKIIRKVINNLPDYSQPDILDVGSGTGILIPFLTEKYGQKAKITELDFAENMIKIAQKKFKKRENIEFIVSDIHSYPLQTNQHDLIICYSVFPHLNNKKNLLKKLKTLLKNRGHLVIFHSQSRKEINNMHKNAEEKRINEAFLPPAQKVVQMAKKENFKVNKTVDNQKLYLLDFFIIEEN